LKQKKLLEMAREGRTDYAIVTTGHSLGAGVAVILALKLKNHFDNVSLGEPAPEIQSFAFSPPGGLLSRDACRLSRECVMSVVLDMDFIPRLSYHTFLHLKDELIREIKKADEPKFEILAKGCWSAFGRCAVECCGDRRQAQASRFEKDGDNQSEERTTSPLSLDDNDQNPLLWTGQQPSYNSGQFH
jgi:pimeloyl-ACP methyl ester carboxylesterase